MLATIRTWLAAPVLLAVGGVLLAQQPDTKQPAPQPKPEPINAQPIKPPPPPPPLTKVAATVNGKKIPEIRIYVALLQVPPDKWDKARPEALAFLIENTMVDQYLD